MATTSTLLLVLACHEIHESLSSLEHAANQPIQTEDWSSIPDGTILQDKLVGGLSYTFESYFGRQLGIYGGGGWQYRLGSYGCNETYGCYWSNMGWSSKIGFHFEEPISEFGVLITQGNYDTPGTPIFEIEFSNGLVFEHSFTVTEYGPNNSFWGISDLGSAEWVKINQIDNGGVNVVWTLYSIHFACQDSDANCHCPADVTKDGDVGLADLIAVLSNWGLSDTPYDTNADGAININDVIHISSNWGPCSG